MGGGKENPTQHNLTTSFQAQAFNLPLKKPHPQCAITSETEIKKEKRTKKVGDFVPSEQKKNPKKQQQQKKPHQSQCTQFASFIGDVTGPQFMAGQAENRMISRV